MQSLSSGDYSVARQRGVLPLYRYASMLDGSTFLVAKEIKRAVRSYAGKQANIKADGELHSTLIGMQSFSRDHVYHGPPTYETVAECEGVLQPVTATLGALVVFGSNPYCIAFTVESEKLQQQRELMEAKFGDRGYPISEMRGPQHMSIAYLYGEHDECRPILRSIREETRFMEGAELALLPASAGRICSRLIKLRFDELGKA